MNKRRRIHDRADGRIQVRAADVCVGETIVYPNAMHLSFEVEESEGCRAGDAPGIRFRSSGLSTVYAERDFVWVAA